MVILKFPIEMYRIKLKDVKVKVPCESCYKKGIVDVRCPKCAGIGTHKKTVKAWAVTKKKETVVAINRAEEDAFYKGVQIQHKGELRYWINTSEFYQETEKVLHFSENDAQKECDRRNEKIAGILKVAKSNGDHGEKKG